MNEYDLINTLSELNVELQRTVSQLSRYGIRLAEKERDYKICLRREALKLRANDMPVTLINQVIYGIEEVANKRFEYHVAEAEYKTAQEKVNSIKLQMRIIDSQISREWGASK